MFVQVEEDEPSDFVSFDKFQPVMAKILTERRYRPSTEEQLVKAFEVSVLTCAALRPCKGSHMACSGHVSWLLPQG